MSSVKCFIDNNANRNNNNCDDGSTADDSLGIMSPSDMSCLPSLTASMISNFAWEDEGERNPESGGKKKQQKNAQVSRK